MIRKNPSGHLPVIDESAYVDNTAIICGKVIIKENVFVGPYVVIRADEVDDRITSYNVCYTKLLRVVLFPGLLQAAGQARQQVVYLLTTVVSHHTQAGGDGPVRQQIGVGHLLSQHLSQLQRLGLGHSEQ